MLHNYAANLHKGFPAGVFPHKLNACSFHYTTDIYLTVKYYYRLFEFFNDTLLHMQPEVLTLGHLKCLNKILKSLNQKF